MDHPHTAAPATGDGLYNDGVANRVRRRESFFVGVNRITTSGQHRQSQTTHFAASPGLVAHEPDCFRWRSDEFDPAGFAYFSEIAAFREKSVSRVNCVGIGHFRSANNAGNIQVTIYASWWADTDCFVREPDVKGMTIGLGEDGNGLDAHFL